MNEQVALPRILIYQDENCNDLIEYLQFYGFSIMQSTDDDILQKIKNGNYDLCILGDYKSNAPSDLRLLKALRETDSKMPVIFISNQFRCEYIIDAFNAGTDDYIVKPYNFEELICRIKALLRRCNIKSRTIEPTYKIGNYIFDTQSNILSFNGTEVKLTNKEGKTLSLLCAYKNELLSKKILLRHVWVDENYFNKRSLDVHMCNLRNYLKMDSRITIKTKRGIGYSLVVENE